MFKITVADTQHQFECAPDDTILHAGPGMSYECNVDSCGTYFAGPPTMAQAVQRMLFDEKVPGAQVHYDAFY